MPLASAQPSAALPVWSRALMAVLVAAGVSIGVVTLLQWRSTATVTHNHEKDVVVQQSAPQPGSPMPSASSIQTTKDSSVATTPSDNVIGTMLGLSAFLVIVGAFFPRITKIVLPGGGEVDMSATDAAKAVAAVRSAVPTLVGPNAPPADVAALTAAATTLTLSKARSTPAPAHGPVRFGFFRPQAVRAAQREVPDAKEWDDLASQSVRELLVSVPGLAAPPAPVPGLQRQPLATKRRSGPGPAPPPPP
jgi:cytoskeletal protein RodZ